MPWSCRVLEAPFRLELHCERAVHPDKELWDDETDLNLGLFFQAFVSLVVRSARLVPDLGLVRLTLEVGTDRPGQDVAAWC